MGYPAALSAKHWGFYDVLRQGKPLEFERPLGSYVMEHVLFKPAFPAEYHAQTAVEAAFKLRALIGNKVDIISKIRIETQEAAVRIIDKKGPLSCPADRDHCLQYMVAIGLLKGELSPEDYEEKAANDPRIDLLRDKMEVVENPVYTSDYHDPDKRTVANALTLWFSDGSEPQRMEMLIPLGHWKRREEAIPVLLKKLAQSLHTCFPSRKAQELFTLFQDHERLWKLPVENLSAYFFVEKNRVEF
jgi:2-methylcitrate dehydratase